MSGSGDHPSDSRGWNHEWFGSTPFPSPDTEFSPPPQTQGSQIPGSYRPYPVDEQDAPDGRYGWAPEQGSGGSGGSQTPPPPTPTPTLTPTPTPRGVRVQGRGGDPHVRTPYTPMEMDKLFKAYLEISEDSEVGTNQSGDRFWWRVSRRYNASRPDGTIERNESMVRNAIFRANEEIQKFQGYYLQEQRSAGSGRSELDIISATMTTYQSFSYKPFKYLSAWQQVRAHPKYRGGLSSSSSSSSKRSRSLSLSDAGEDEVASQLAGANLGSPDAAPSSSQRRPQGRKQATANRRRAPSASRSPAPAPAPFVPPQPPTNSLWAVLAQLNLADRSNMSPDQLEAHIAMIRGLRQTLGIGPEN